ncbi:hypothetical protein [Nonomuraea sp. NPDC049400]|uniref:hypothetical protein n=1 Tax=Nonomuraea sp. NPDC049400 TaxID=3364352 RepID=UPI0037A383B3
MSIDNLTDYLPPTWVWWLVGGACSLVATWITTRAAVAGVRYAFKALHGRTNGESDTNRRPTELEDVLTWAIAAIATGVSASGMWKFAGDVLGLDGFFRVLFFAFIEGAIVISALRARRSMRENYTAGVDGIAVWALAALTAVLASLDAAHPGEVVFRLAAPMVAAWLWERGMRLERRKLRGLSGIHWRLTPERLLVRIGLAEATDRTASEVDAHRRLTRVALAAKQVHMLRAVNASERKIRKAAAKLDKRLDQAVEHTGLARDHRMKWALLDQVGTLGGAESLCNLLETAQGPWALTDHPLVTGAAKHHEAVQLAEAMREWSDTLKQQRDPEVSAAVTSMAAYIAQMEGRPVPDMAEPAPTTSVAPTVASPAFGATETRPITRPEMAAPAAPLTVVNPVAIPVADDDDFGDRTRDRDGDQDGDRERPDEQDNREAREWIRVRCRGRNGVGRKPSKTEVSKRFGFSETWAFSRIQEVQERMTAQGYTFESDGTVNAPTRSVADTDASGRAEVSA